jgi:hypothetical protein
MVALMKGISEWTCLGQVFTDMQMVTFTEGISVKNPVVHTGNALLIQEELRIETRLLWKIGTVVAMVL